MHLTLQRGTRLARLRVLLTRHDPPGGRAGRTPDTEGLRVAYLRDSDDAPQPIALRPWQPDAPGAFRAVDADAMPGLYELILPDAVTAVGADRATVMLHGPSIRPRVVHLDLVAYDPYDRDRLGLDCLSQEARHVVISRAFREVIPEIVEEFRRG